MLIKEFKGGQCNPEFREVMAAAFVATITERLIYISQWHLIFVWAYSLALIPLPAQTQAYLHKSKKNWVNKRIEPTWNQTLQQPQIWTQNLAEMHFPSAVH